MLAWLMAITFLVLLVVEAVDFHRNTVCRQIAWKESVILATRATLSTAKESDWGWHGGCRLKINRVAKSIHWQRLPKGKHSFLLDLSGQL